MASIYPLNCLKPFVGRRYHKDCPLNGSAYAGATPGADATRLATRHYLESRAIAVIGEPTVKIEFFGMPRHKAERAEMNVRARTIGEALAAAQAVCPGLGDLIGEDGELSRHYLLCVDGQVFVRDLLRKLESGTRLLLLSADPGG